MEDYREIEGYNGKYIIGDRGSVYSYKTKRFLKTAMSTAGYKQVTLCLKGKVKTHAIHRLVAEHFLLNPENKPQVNHKNGNRLDNQVDNLEWCTGAENSTHSIQVLGNPPPPTYKGKFGKDHNRSKAIYEFDQDGNLTAEYESGLDFQRKTGHNHSSPSWGIKTGKLIFGKYYRRTPHFEWT